MRSFLSNKPSHKHLGVILAITLLGSVLLVMAPAQAGAPVSKTFASNTFTVRHNGNKFRVAVSASKFGEGEFFNINFSQSKNPPGVRSGTRSIGYSGDTNFSVNDKFSDGKLNPSNNQMGSHGDIQMDWTATKPLQMSCNGHNRSRKGFLHGKFVFKTGENKLGTVRKHKIRGSMSGSDNNCPFGGGGGNACPTKGISLFSAAQEAFWGGSKRSGAGSLVVSLGKVLPGGWNRGQSVFATVPGSNVTLNDNEKNGKFQGASGTYFSGKSNYTSAAGSGNPTNYTPCKGGKEYVSQSSSGVFSRGLKADFIVGPDRVLKGTGNATRTLVRNA